MTATHDGEAISYAYDTIGRVTSQTYAGGRVVGYDWDAANNLTRLTWPDGFAVDYVWDANNRVTQAQDGARLLRRVENLLTIDSNNQLLGRLDLGSENAQVYFSQVDGNVEYPVEIELPVPNKSMMLESISSAKISGCTMEYSFDDPTNNEESYDGRLTIPAALCQ